MTGGGNPTAQFKKILVLKSDTKSTAARLSFSAESTILFISVSHVDSDYRCLNSCNVPVSSANSHKQVGEKLVGTLIRFFKLTHNEGKSGTIVIPDILAFENFKNFEQLPQEQAINKAAHYSRKWLAQYEACRSAAEDELKKEGLIAKNDSLHFDILTWDRFDEIENDPREISTQENDSKNKALFKKFRQEISTLFNGSEEFRSAVNADAENYRYRKASEGRTDLKAGGFLPYLLRELPYFLLAHEQGVKTIAYYNVPLLSFEYLVNARRISIDWVRVTPQHWENYVERKLAATDGETELAMLRSQITAQQKQIQMLSTLCYLMAFKTARAPTTTAIPCIAHYGPLAGANHSTTNKPSCDELDLGSDSGDSNDSSSRISDGPGTP